MRKVNAHKFTLRFINEGIEFLKADTIPSRFQFPSRKNEFRARYNGMKVENELLYFGKMQVVPHGESEIVLANLFKETGDIGRDRFYALVKKHYVGITRKQVQMFLNNQEVHQLVVQVKKQRVNKAIITSKPMERWQADLVDVSKYKSLQNKNATFLLTVIDCFSKFAWVVPLKTKHAAVVATALEQVLADAKGAPEILQTDNGGEFEQEFERVLERHGISHARSRSYHPQANGQIERFNGTFKRMIQSHMLTNNTKTFVPKLPEILAMYNLLLHTGTGQAPIDAHSKPELWPKVGTKLRDQAMKTKKRGRQTKRPPLYVGDTVRVAIIHQPMDKPVTFLSKELHQVIDIIEPGEPWDATTYELHDGRKFTRDRLQKVDPAKTVYMEGKPQTRKKASTTSKTKQPITLKSQPQRERAPSSIMRDHFVDL